MNANITDITDLTDAELDVLLGLDDAEQTYEEIVAESRAVLAESRVLRATFRGVAENHINCATR